MLLLFVTMASLMGTSLEGKIGDTLNATIICQLLEKRPHSFKGGCARRASTVHSRTRKGH